MFVGITKDDFCRGVQRLACATDSDCLSSAAEEQLICNSLCTTCHGEEADACPDGGNAVIGSVTESACIDSYQSPGSTLLISTVLMCVWLLSMIVFL